MATASFDHAAIGKITGNGGDGCTQFLGVKYATLKDRFATAELARYDGSGLDATRYGPQVVCPPNGVDIEHSFIQQSLPKPDFPGISDVDCLTINITIPGGVGKGGPQMKDLPVLVFIPGGGFIMGGNWWPQYDFAKLVKLSAELGKPIIGITINHRVGPLGFLTFPELRAAGYKPNNALRDQRVALRWVKEYIAGFGGNPNEVTVMGESAGGVSTGLLLLSKEPLTKRLVCLGGCPPLMGQLPLEAADGMAKSTLSLLGLGDVDSSKLVQSLLELPEEDFFTKIPPGHPSMPTIDGDIISDLFTFQSFAGDLSVLPGKAWIDSILVASSKLDGSIMAYGLLSRLPGIAEAFRASATKTLHDHPDTLSSLLDQYSLTESATSTATDHEVMFNIVRFISDVAFLMPAIELAATASCESFVLAFNEPNPWDGLFKGHASHIMDVVFLFQNYNAHLNEKQRAIAVTFGEDIIKFTNGEAPWKAFNRGQHGFAVYENGTKSFTEPPSAKMHPIFVLGKDEKGPGMDRLMEVFTNFISEQ